MSRLKVILFAALLLTPVSIASANDNVMSPGAEYGQGLQNRDASGSTLYEAYPSNQYAPAFNQDQFER